MSRARVAVVVATVLVVIGVLLILRDGTPDRSPTPNAEPTKTTEPSGPDDPPTKQPPPEKDRSPFTGLAGKAKPVLAVKIDNVGPARPATGLASADVVYVEPVEAGLSRLFAVFSSRLPDTVGPVRSARESDIELVRQFGRPAFAYSGAHSRVLPLLARASFYDVSAARAGAAYSRSSSRPAPHNLYADPRALLNRAPKASRAHDIGFRFGARPSSGGRQVDSYPVRYPAFGLDIQWSKANQRWRLAMDGDPVRSAGGADPAPATVVVQYTRIRDSRFQDSGGNVTPYVESVGSGRAVVLRNGRAYDARWSRPSAKRGTTFSTRSGAPMRFARGNVWVVFAYDR